MKSLKLTSALLSAVMCFSMVTAPVMADETQVPSETEITETEEEKETEKPSPKDEEKQEPDKEEPAAQEPEAEKEEPSGEDENEPESGEGEVPGDEDSKDALDAIASGKCGKKLKWTLDKYGTITITGKGSMYSYKPTNGMPLDRPWEKYTNDIKKLVVSKGVTTIGKYAFDGCENMTSVSLPKTLKIIDEGAFIYTGLTSVSIPNGVTTIRSHAFYACRNLLSVKIADSVTKIERSAFQQSTSLKSVTLSKNLKVIEDHLFHTCPLESIIIPNGVTSIGDYAFSSCIFKSVTIPASVKTIGDSAFYYNTYLKKVIVPKSGLTSIGNRAFATTGIESFEVPLTVTSIGESAFANCSELCQIWLSDTQKNNLPSNVKSGSPYSYYFEHSYCIIGEQFNEGNLSYIVTNPSTGGTSGTVAVYAFGASDEKIVVPNTVTHSNDQGYTNVTYKVTKITASVSQYNDTLALKNLVIGSNVSVIADGAFANCLNLEFVTGGAGLKAIGTNAFANCPKLKTFTINSKVLYKIGASAFYADKALVTLNLKKTTKLTKGGVKNSLKGSSVKTVKVKKSRVRKYKKFFKKKNSGKSVKVKK